VVSLGRESSRAEAERKSLKEIIFLRLLARKWRPGRLTALIKKRPSDCLQPERDSTLSTKSGESELTKLAVASSLFHRGYLTMDKTKQS
jgi:hypothetical protein